MQKSIIVGIVASSILIFFSSLTFAQSPQPPGGQPPSQVTPKPTLPQPQLSPPPAGKAQVFRPHLVRFKINGGAAVATNPTVTLDFTSIPRGATRQEDVVASKPTHYRWQMSGGFPLRCEVGTAYNWSNWVPIHPNITPFATLQRYCKSRNNGVNNDVTLTKGLCGATNIRLQVMNSAGESNVREDKIDFISDSEFIIDDLDELLKAYSARLVSSSLGSSCKVHHEILRYVRGAEALSGFDETVLFGLSYGDAWLGSNPSFFATGATPANGSRCEYELYPKVLPAGWSVLSFSTYCYSKNDGHRSDASGCVMIKVPSPGSRDLTTRVRVWTDAQKAPGVWGYIHQGEVVLKGDCRGLNEPNSPRMK